MFSFLFRLFFFILLLLLEASFFDYLSYLPLKVFIAVLLGAYVGSDWAYQAFHNNISWVVFIGYFFLFWYLVFPRIRR